MKEKSGIPPASAGSDRLRGYNKSMDETGGDGMPVIYLDVLVVLNWFIDYLLLSSTARILRLPFKRWRLVLGALLGGISSCLIFLPAMPFWLSLLVKLVAGSLIVLAAFPWLGIRAYGKQMLVFLVISAAFAGIATAVWFFAAPAGFLVANGVVYFDVPPLLLVGLTVLSYACIRLYDRFIRKKAPVNREFRLPLDAGEGEVTLRALCDTGLHLTEPFSGSPVIVVRQPAVYHHLTPALQEALSLQDPPGEPFYPSGTDAAQAVASRLRMVPYQTVGGKGLLPAFQVKKAKIAAPGRPDKDITGVYIAMTPEIGRGEYEALFGCDIGEYLA